MAIDTRLTSFVERLERVHAEKAAAVADEKDILAEAKAASYTPKTVTKVVKYRALDAAAKMKIEAADEEFKTYLGNLDS